MTSLRYHEKKQRGSIHFPLDYHWVSESHERYEMPYHWHEDVEIIHIVHGSFSLTIGGENHMLHDGDIAFIPSGVLHGGKPENCEYECVVFQTGLLLHGNEAYQNAMAEILDGTLEVGPHITVEQGALHEALLPMFAALQRNSDGRKMITLGCLMRFIGDVYASEAYTRRAHPSGVENRKMLKLKTVITLIEQNYAKPLSLQELSASVGMSPKYFCRFFKDATHRTPVDYVAYYRIEAACHAFSATELNVTQVAMDLGFSDVNYFIRCFKKHKGVTPGQYRHMLRDGQLNVEV